MKSFIYGLCGILSGYAAFTACRPDAYLPDFAVCGEVSGYAGIKAAGYGYVEPGVGYLMPDRSDAEFQAHLDEIRAVKAKIISCTSFIPGRLPLVGAGAKQAEAVVWADSALRRAGIAEIPCIVLGSGRARNIPEGFSREEAAEQFVAFCKKIAPLAEKYGVTVVIEPLNSSETNFINTLGEGAQIVEAVNHRNIRLLCDIYHMMKENESAEEIVRYGKYIRHCHIAEKEGRTSPGRHGDDFTPYFRALKQIKYRGCVSIECNWGDFDRELQPALKYMQQQFESL
jgi:sugar phosphate isomerase/epimerase